MRSGWGDDCQASGVGTGGSGSRKVQSHGAGRAAHQGLPQAGSHRAPQGTVQHALDGPGEPARDDRGMRPLRTRLQEACRSLGIPWEALERDYLLSWVLAGISQIPVLEDSLVLRGGTAPRKCYFGDYRFSEDLDFSAVAGAPTGEEMERTVGEACETAARLLDEYAPVEIACERYIEREPHPRGQEAFAIRARFPWQGRPQTRVMIQVTVDESIMLSPQRRRVIHRYGEPLEVGVQVYSL